jgi:hypothetical protein
MAKQQSFADKAAKSAREKGSRCPKCDTIKQPLLIVQSVPSKKTKSMSFLKKRVALCKCNEKEIYG